MTKFLLIPLFLLSVCLNSQTNLEYDRILPFSNGYALVQNGEKFGFIDVNGNLQGSMNIKPKNSGRNPIGMLENETFIQVEGGSREGLKTLDGTIKLNSEYIIFEKGNFVMAYRSTDLFNREWKVFSKEMELIYEKAYSKKIKNPIIPLADNLFGEKDIENNSYRLINSSGEIITEALYKDLGVLNNGLLRAKRFSDERGKLMWGFINNLGEEKVSFKFTNKPGNFSNSRALVQTREGKFGYIDLNGQLVIEAKYKRVYQFKNGQALVKVGHLKYEIINTDGSTIYDLIGYSPANKTVRLDDPIIEENVLRLVKSKGLKKCLLSLGDFKIIETEYKFMGEFNNNRALVSKFDNQNKQVYGYIDTSGHMIMQKKRTSPF